MWYNGRQMEEAYTMPEMNVKQKCEELKRPWINESPSHTHFRIWDTKCKTWYGWQDENTLPYYGFDPFCGEVVTMQKWPLDWHEYEWLRVDQSTGILDKNGIEIYQNDLILTQDGHDYNSDDDLIIWQVVYSKDARFSLKPLNYQDEGYRKDFFDFNSPTEEWEVIGSLGDLEGKKYFCPNCLKFFQTGKFDEKDNEIYDDICPYCGCPGQLIELPEKAQ